MNIRVAKGTDSLSTHRGKLIARWLGLALAALPALLLTGCVYESLALSADAKAYPPPGQLIDIGGYRLHINCIGTGSPVVIIEAGLGDWSTSWGAFVQPVVAQTTRVCTYDRAGMGWSEAGPMPRDAMQHSGELQALLHGAQIPGPYIMVGHSMGGLIVRVFAGQHASEVAGMVLIDSMNPDQLRPAQADQTKTHSHSEPFSLQARLARFGIARLLVKIPQIAPALPPNMAAYYPLYIREQSLQTTANEAQGMIAAGVQSAAVKSLGNLPLVVLTARLNSLPGWPAWQTDLLSLSSNSQQLFAEHSGHNVQLDEPEAAISAIRNLIEQVRLKKAK